MYEIDPTSPVPLYLQIGHAVRRLIAIGALRPGDRLPAVRDLAIRARVNRNTAARAIQHLEGQGVVRTRVGQGTFVEAPVDGDRNGEIERWLDRWVGEAAQLGLPLEELRARLESRIAGGNGHAAGPIGSRSEEEGR